MLPLLLVGLMVATTVPVGRPGPDETPVASWAAYIDSLDKDDLDSFSQAITQFKSCCRKLPRAQADSVFKNFQTFFFATISRHNDLIWEDLDFLELLHTKQRPREPQITDFLGTLRRNGLALYTLSELYYIDQTAGYLYRHFYPYVSRAVKDYLSLRKRELAAGFSDDERLVITLANLGTRVVAWEYYLNKHPNSIMLETAKYYYRIYLSAFLTGLRRSPAFGPDGTLDPARKRVYATFFRRYDGTRAAELVEDYYFLLADVDFTWSQPVKDFYQRHNIINMHTFQVPYR